ncbi:MAG: class I SAM-dependent methyltransferase [Candidatus Eutrophobiaceae bacterium]
MDYSNAIAANLKPEERIRESALRKKLVSLIDEHGGSIGFDVWMHHALQDPLWGYYSNHSGNFGECGDFATAPELSPLYAACLARQCAQILQALEVPSDILEIGAGSGRLAYDLLVKLDECACPPQRYLIFEPSPRLRERQRECLAKYAERVTWVDELPEEPVRGIILANEVLDSLPVKRFAIQDGEILEQGVGLNTHQQFHFKHWPADEDLRRLLHKRLPIPTTELPDGYCSEINAGLASWIRRLAQCLGQGVILFVDYGYPATEYYHPQRTAGSLLCHYRHRVHDNSLILVGLQDITASVDFTAVAEEAVQSGLQVLGYTSQAWFLMATGLEQELQGIVDADAPSRVEIARQARKLTLPGEMGERFKVMALGSRYESLLQGFTLYDQRGTLNRKSFL